MKFFVLFALLLVNAATGFRVGKPRIVGGSETNIATFPWMVSIQHRDTEHICGGAIISNQWIVTGAQCIYTDMEDFVIRAGSTDVYQGGTVFEIAEHVIHPNYGEVTYGDLDVAVVRIDGTFNAANNMVPIQISATEPNSGDNVLVSGWGVTGNEETPANLHFGTLTIITRDTCVEVYDAASITENKFCTRVDGVGTCYGDGGSPLITTGANPAIVGVVSWATNCAESYPDVHTNLVSPAIRNFIRDVTNI